jgi:hypothetical protein
MAAPLPKAMPSISHGGQLTSHQPSFPIHDYTPASTLFTGYVLPHQSNYVTAGYPPTDPLSTQPRLSYNGQQVPQNPTFVSGYPPTEPLTTEPRLSYDGQHVTQNPSPFVSGYPPTKPLTTEPRLSYNGQHVIQNPNHFVSGYPPTEPLTTEPRLSYDGQHVTQNPNHFVSSYSGHGPPPQPNSVTAGYSPTSMLPTGAVDDIRQSVLPQLVFNIDDYLVPGVYLTEHDMGLGDHLASDAERASTLSHLQVPVQDEPVPMVAPSSGSSLSQSAMPECNLLEAAQVNAETAHLIEPGFNFDSLTPLSSTEMSQFSLPFDTSDWMGMNNMGGFLTSKPTTATARDLDRVSAKGRQSKHLPRFPGFAAMLMPWSL